MASVTVLKDEVVARLGSRTDLAARALMWLNDGYFELLLSPRFMFSELDTTGSLTLASGAQSVDLTTLGTGQVFAIWHLFDTTNHRRLQRSDMRVLDDLQRDVAGAPLQYARYGETLEIYPQADAAYTLRVRYRRRPAELADGGTHLLGREWDEVLICLAVTKGWEALEQFEKAAAQRQLLEGMLSQREEMLRLEDGDAETTIGVGSPWG